MSTEMGSKHHVTLEDVARTARVSKATASKALNDRPDVSTETKLRVRAAVDELGYVASTRSPAAYPNVAVVADTFDQLYTLEVLGGAARECLLNGVAMTTTHLAEGIDTPFPHPLQDDWLRLIASKGYLGLVLITTEVNEHLVDLAKRLDLHLVVIDPASIPPPDVHSIGATNWNGGLDATQHLIDLGHRRIAYIHGPDGSLPSRERFMGYMSALQMNNIPTSTDLARGGSFTYRSGLAAARELLARPATERPTAFFAASDSSALGVIEATREVGLRVPQDVSVVGFDDTSLAVSSAPRLTTVRQPLRDMGASAIRAIIGLRSGTHPTGPMKLNTTLVLRDSSAPPPAS